MHGLSNIAFNMIIEHLKYRRNKLAASRFKNRK
jgi:hypothetical protein